MKRAQIISELVKLHKASLNPKSKFFKQDLEDFKTGLSKIKSESRLNQMLHNRRCLSGLDKTFNKELEKEEKAMLKAGMFNMANLAPNKALS